MACWTLLGHPNITSWIEKTSLVQIVMLVSLAFTRQLQARTLITGIHTSLHFIVHSLFHHGHWSGTSGKIICCHFPIAACPGKSRYSCSVRCADCRGQMRGRRTQLWRVVIVTTWHLDNRRDVLRAAFCDSLDVFHPACSSDTPGPQNRVDWRAFH